MDTYQPLSDILDIAGSCLDTLYCLINIERDIEEYIGHIYKLKGNQWRLYLKDEKTFFTDMLLLDDDNLLLACEDGRLLHRHQGNTYVYPTPNRYGYCLAAYGPNKVVLHGRAICLLDVATMTITKLYESRTLWAESETNPKPNCISLVGSKGQVAVFDNDQLKVIATPFTDNLVAVHHHRDTLIVGGWNGVIRRRLNSDDLWEDISLPTDETVTCLITREDELLACARGVYVFDEITHQWCCEIDPQQNVIRIRWIAGTLLACCSATQEIVRWGNGMWARSYPSLFAP